MSSTPEKPVPPEPPKAKTWDEAFQPNLHHFYYSTYKPVREQQALYFEKLVLLNGGTVALAITAILGNLHGNIKHRYTLRTALCSLVIAMLLSMARNWSWTKYEASVTDLRFGSADYVTQKGEQLEKLDLTAMYLGFAALVLTGLGMVLLLIVALSLI